MNKTKVLVVEDEIIVAKNIEKRLVNSGYSVCGVASGGIEAIKLAIETSPDVIVMDIKLQGEMDGVGAAERINEELDIPVVFLTSFADEITFQRAKAAKPFGYLLKPFETKELQRTIDMALYKHEIDRKLRESQTRYSIAGKAGKTGIWEYLPSEKKIFTDNNMKALLGYESEEIIDSVENWLSIFHPDDRVIVEGLSKLTSGTPTQNEFRMIHKDKSVKWFVFGGELILPDRNQPVKIIGSCTDITERKLAEEKLARYADELKMLNSAKDKFFSIISHDLRNPFNTLLGLTDFIANNYEELSENELRESVKNINRSAKNLYSLLTNLLEWSRLQTGRLVLKPTEFNISEIIDNTIQLYFDILKIKNITVTNLVPKELKVYADPNMIETVIRNLISNAIKFSKQDDYISVLSSEDQNHTSLTIKDNGIGISEDNLQKLFKIDELLVTAGTDGEKGTGLGLILCKEFLEKNNGTISVISKFGKGSSFTITLPKYQTTRKR
ncbi:MAG: response regulator [Ignavibacteriaceae bacterium]|nr:response regulator [Ignavibacteriaceae bacterium]